MHLEAARNTGRGGPFQEQTVWKDVTKMGREEAGAGGCRSEGQYPGLDVWESPDKQKL